MAPINSSAAEHVPYVPAAVREGKWLTEFRRRVSCGEQAIETVGTEPGAVLNAVAEGARKLGMPMISWDPAGGFLSNDENIEPNVERLGAPPDDQNPDGLDDPGLRTPLAALRAIPRFRLPAPGHAIFALSNFYVYFQDDLVRQEFENLCKWNLLSNRDVKRPIHFIQHPFAKMQLTGLDSVRHWIHPHPFPLPTALEIEQEQVAEILQSLDPKEAAKISDQTKKNVAQACLGLPRHKVTSLLYYAVSKFGGLNDKVASAVRRETAAAITKEYPFLTLIHDEDIVAPEHLAGCRNVFGYIERAARRRTVEYRRRNASPAKGMWLSGLSGTGKTEVMKTASIVFERVTGRPCKVIFVNVPGMLGSLVGESEQNWLAFEAVAEQFPEDIFVFDEAEKALDAEGDTSGVRKDIQSMFLQWLNKQQRSFVAMSMNNPASLPPELLRRVEPGFFFDLPKAPTRIQILKIHFDRAFKLDEELPEDLRHHGALGFTAEDWETLGKETEGWIPDELKDLVADARDHDFVPDLNLILDRIKAKGRSIMSIRRADDLRQLRELCKDALPLDYDDVPTATVSAVAARGRMPRTQKRALDGPNAPSVESN